MKPSVLPDVDKSNRHFKYSNRTHCKIWTFRIIASSDAGLGALGVAIPIYYHMTDHKTLEPKLSFEKDGLEMMVTPLQEDPEISPGRPASFRHRNYSKIVKWKGDLSVFLKEEGIETPFYYSHIRIDHRGFRNPLESDNKEQFPVIFLGDSFLDESQMLYENLLTTQFQKITGIPTYNLGLGGIGPLDEFNILKKTGLGLKPELVFWNVFGGNDFSGDHPRPVNYDYFAKHSQGPSKKGNESVEDLPADAGKQIYEMKNMVFLYDPDGSDVKDLNWSYYETIFEEAVSLSKQHDFDLEIIYIPPKGAVYPEEQRISWEKFTVPKRLERLCQRLNIGFTDLTERLRTYKHQPTYIPEDTHLSRFGAIVNCCVLRDSSSGGFLHDSVFEGTSFDDKCDLFVAA